MSAKKKAQTNELSYGAISYLDYDFFGVARPNDTGKFFKASDYLTAIPEFIVIPAVKYTAIAVNNCRLCIQHAGLPRPNEIG